MTMCVLQSAPMKKRNWKLFLAFLFLFGLLHCAGSGVVNEESGELQSGAPVDIPVPIAKAINGADATTARFVPDIELNQGVLYANLKEPGEERIVGMIIEGEFVDFVTTDDEIVFEVPESRLGQPMALVVLSQLSTEEDINAVSVPVIVTINEPSDSFEDYQTQVAITNTNNSTTGLVVDSRRSALSADHLLAFSATDPDGNPYIGTLEASGGAISVLTSSITSTFERALYDADGNLFGLDTETGLLLRVEDSGAITEEDIDISLLPTGSIRHFDLSPNGDWVASAIYDPDSIGGTLIVNLSPADTPRLGVLVRMTGGESQVTNIDLTWVDNTTLIVVKNYTWPASSIQVYDVASLLDADASNQEAELVPQALFSSDTQAITQVFKDPNDSTRFAYIGKNTVTDFFDLYLFDRNSDTSSLIVSGTNFNVNTAAFNSDSTLILFGIGNGDVEDISSKMIGVYQVEENDFSIILRGFYPSPSPVDPDIVGYVGYDDDNLLQMSVINLSYLGF